MAAKVVKQARPTPKSWEDLTDRERLTFLASALVDLNLAAEAASRGCHIAEDSPDDYMQKELYISQAHMAVVSYCRMFLPSDFETKQYSSRLPQSISPIVSKYSDLHKRVMYVRSNSVAHNFLGLRKALIWKDGAAYVSQVSHELIDPPELDRLATLALSLKSDLDLMFQKMAGRVFPDLTEADGKVDLCR